MGRIHRLSSLLLVLHGLHLALERVDDAPLLVLPAVALALHLEKRRLVGVVAELRHGQSLERPTGGNHVADDGHVARGAARGEVGERHHQSAEQYLGNQKNGDADVDAHHGVEPLREQQTGETGQEGRHEEHQPPHAERARKSHDPSARQHEESRLHGAHHDRIAHLAPDVGAVGQAQEFLAFEQTLVADDFLGRTAHADEGGHDDGHEEERHEVLVLHERVARLGRVVGEPGTDERQKGRLQKGDEQILQIGGLAVQVAVEEYPELAQEARALLLVGRKRLLPDLFQVAAPREIHLVPLPGRHLAAVGLLAALREGFFVDDIEHHLGVHGAA